MDYKPCFLLLDGLYGAILSCSGTLVPIVETLGQGRCWFERCVSLYGQSSMPHLMGRKHGEGPGSGRKGGKSGQSRADGKERGREGRKKKVKEPSFIGKYFCRVRNNSIQDHNPLGFF